VQVAAGLAAGTAAAAGLAGVGHGRADRRQRASGARRCSTAERVRGAVDSAGRGGSDASPQRADAAGTQRRRVPEPALARGCSAGGATQ
jgi:hypothetical protein